MQNIAILRTAVAATMLGLLAGCGAGGGSGSTQYSISLHSDKTSLPLNISNLTAYVGSPYTTTLYVNATDSMGNPIPGAKDNIGCSVVDGLDSAALYYLDGDSAHEKKVTDPVTNIEYTYPLAYRSITLSSNAGSASFHLGSTDIAGTVRVRCSVSDPAGVVSSAEVNVLVGGNPSGKVSQVVPTMTATTPAYTGPQNWLFAQGYGQPTQLVIQYDLVDEAGQHVVPDPRSNNLQVRIVPNPNTHAEDDALLSGTTAGGQLQTASSIIVHSYNGIATVSLISGTSTGSITLEAVSDRADNNVDNGIQDPVYNYVTIPVVTQAYTSSGTALAITATTLPDATQGIPYGALLEATGGAAPYTWSLAPGSVLPTGLMLSNSGIISGLPAGSTSGTFNFVVQVMDVYGSVSSLNMSIKYTSATASTAATPTITTTSLSAATAGDPYVQILTATGGTTPYTWSLTSAPAGLTINATTGVLSGTIASAGTYSFVVSLVDNNGAPVSKLYTLTVN